MNINADQYFGASHNSVGLIKSSFYQCLVTIWNSRTGATSEKVTTFYMTYFISEVFTVVDPIES